MRKILCMCVVLLAAPAAWALDANQVRGGWETTDGGPPHIFEFTIRGDRVAGVYCTVCDDGETLAFVDGRLGADAMTFVVNHVRDDGSTAYQDHVSARIEGDHLAVSGMAGGPGGGSFHWDMRKDQRGPAPFGGVKIAEALPQPGAPAVNVAAYGRHGQALPPGGLQIAAGPPWQQPGPWEPLTPARLAGIWLNGTGPAKQYFIIRRVGNGLLGLVCGPCDNPYSMVALTDFVIHGDTLTFNISHEDNGIGALPFHNHIVAHLAKNELRLVSIVADNQPPPPPGRPARGISLLGPLPLE